MARDALFGAVRGPVTDERSPQAAAKVRSATAAAVRAARGRRFLFTVSVLAKVMKRRCRLGAEGVRAIIKYPAPQVYELRPIAL
jgi:hypothetical protein